MLTKTGWTNDRWAGGGHTTLNITMLCVENLHFVGMILPDKFVFHNNVKISCYSMTTSCSQKKKLHALMWQQYISI